MKNGKKNRVIDYKNIVLQKFDQLLNCYTYRYKSIKIISYPKITFEWNKN